MVSKFALIDLLLASAALAHSSFERGARLGRRRENARSQLINSVEGADGVASKVLYSENWSGALWDKPNGTFTAVSATFIVPVPSGANGSAGGAWVGIDGGTCQDTILQTGLQWVINGTEVVYNVWYEWYPLDPVNFSGIIINAGDVLCASVVAYNMASGVAVIENYTNGQKVRQRLSSSVPLCGQNAEWIVEDYALDSEGDLVSFADFGSVTFTRAVAHGPNGTILTPSGAQLVDMRQNKTILTNVTNSGDDLTITYVGGEDAAKCLCTAT